MSGDPEQEYFSDGITEDIITDLRQGLHSRGHIAQQRLYVQEPECGYFQDRARTEGQPHPRSSVRKAGECVRITAQLIDGSRNEHVWAERYDRALHDIFALQDEISGAIVRR